MRKNEQAKTNIKGFPNQRKRTKFDVFKQKQDREMHPSLKRLIDTHERIESQNEYLIEEEKQAQNSKKSLNFLEKFAFGSSSKPSINSNDKSKFDIDTKLKNTKKTTTSKSKKAKAKKKKMEQSNLFVTNLGNEESDHESDANSQDKAFINDGELDYEMHDNEEQKTEEVKQPRINSEPKIIQPTISEPTYTNSIKLTQEQEEIAAEARKVLIDSDDEKLDQKYDYTQAKNKYNLMKDL